tara:strand:+ start:1309 stop:1797 length:489 start_codon:yes stop_codon:yes gene_type:complete
MKKLILLTTLLLAFACSKDDEEETFLDKYDGTSWTVEEDVSIDGEVADGGGVEIITFSNGTYFYSQFVGGGGAIDALGASFDCMQYKEGRNVIFGGMELTYKILKNEADELLSEATLLGEVIGTIKFTPQGENLVMTETSIEEGIETAILIPSDSSYDDYCN